MRYEAFSDAFGPPAPATGVEPAALGLAHHPELVAFASEVGGGSFAGGLVSVASVREAAIDLSAWRPWLPDDALPFASSAVGYVYAVSGSAVWVLNSHAGLVMRTGLSIEELLLRLAEPETQDGTLGRPTFELWRELNGDLDLRSVIAPSLPEVFGGTWAMAELVAVPIGVHLAISGQWFGPDGDLPAKILTDDDDLDPSGS